MLYEVITDYYQARRTEAAATYREALALADARADMQHAGVCLWSLGCIEMWSGDLARAVV